jgi:DNA mismatch endonuclease (patch repair protein)
MMDEVDPPVTPARSAMMARVGRKNTAPEMVVRRAAHRLGLRFRIHPRGLPGTPDLVFPRWKTAVFVHGCFWHRHAGCQKASAPKTRAAFWQAKFDRNVARDHRVAESLREAGWRVETLWECETLKAERLASRLGEIFTHPPERSGGPLASVAEADVKD